MKSFDWIKKIFSANHFLNQLKSKTNNHKLDAIWWINEDIEKPTNETTKLNTLSVSIDIWVANERCIENGQKKLCLFCKSSR